MATAILQTKIQSPRLHPKNVGRAHLIEQLNFGLSLQRKLTLVSAPAGYGKTTLITQWLNENGRWFSWLSLDSEENDVYRFLAYMVASIQRNEPRFGENITDLLKLPNPPSPFDLLTLFINEANDLSKPIVLVLDDYQLISASGVHKLVEFFLKHLPTNFHLVLLSRTVPPFSFAKLRACNHITEIGVQELSFSENVAQEFLHEVMAVPLPKAEIEMLTRQTEGWVVGLQLVAISLRNKINTMPATQLLEGVQGTQFMIADYLVEEVLAQQSAEVRAFLQRSCLLDRFNLEMAEFLADWEVAEMPASYDPQESTNILNHLQQSNLFLTALDENHTWFRYHALFAGYIRASLTDSQKRQLYQGASAWCATRGLKHEAIEYAVRAKDYVTVAQLFRQFGGILRGQGEYRALFHWLDSIPRAEVESYLHLRVLKGWAMWYEGDVAGAINQCDRLKPLLQEISDENELASVANFVGFLLYVKGEVKLAKEISQIALQKIDPQNPEIFFSYITYSYCEGCLGNFEGALDINQKLLRLSKQFDRYMDLAFTIRERAVILRHLGRRREAIVSCLQGLDYFVNQRSRTITSSGFVHLALSIHYLDGNELDLARHHLEIAEDLCRHISVLSTKILIWSTWSHLYWVEGEPEKAINALAEADNLLLQYKDQILFLSPHVVAMQLRLGQINSVRHWAEKHELSLGIFPDYKYLTAHLVFARLLLLQNQLSDASNYLQMVSRMARHTKQLWILINARLIQSLVEQKKGNQENAVEYLGQAVRLAEVEGYSRVFLDEGKMLIPLLRLVRPAAPAFVKELLAELGVDEGVERKMPAFSPPSYTTLSQRQIEILQLAANGLTNREIANRLHITIGTTKWHFSQIYRELNVRNRTQAIAKARELAIFSNL